MWRMCGLMSGAMLIAVLWIGCGSTGGDDQLVMQFLHFDNTGITQADSVRETSADVDIVPGECLSGTTITPEPFTQTIINAVFRNNEASDIRLNQVVIDVDPKSQLQTITRELPGLLPGGECNNIDQQCASDADCQGVVGACSHTETTIGSILLFDFSNKLHIVTAPVVGSTYNVTITFFGSDPNRSFETTTHYVVTFANFDNCKTTTGG